MGAAVAALLAGCDRPPQVLQIAPTRGAQDVRSNQPVDITFDRAMDRASVAAHFHVTPSVQGSLTWVNDHELSFTHVPFDPRTQYQVALESGYRDADGTANTFRHSWTFETEAAPVLTDSGPSAGQRNVDPAATVTLTFTREMDAASLAGAVSLTPATPFVVRLDPADARRAIVAPVSLLNPGANYTVSIGQTALDIDGNRLASEGTVSFSTGAARPLQHWVGFVAQSPDSGTGAGVWAVGADRIPRELVSGPVTAFAWSPAGNRLLVRDQDGQWADEPLDGSPVPLHVRADWAGYLAPGDGYAFLAGDKLEVLRPDGTATQIATGVDEAATSPDGGSIAFVTAAGTGRGSEIDVYDVDLHAHYRLQADPGVIDGLAWAPDGLALAYRVDAGDTRHRVIHVRSLRDGSNTVVAIGQVSQPQWQADRQHLFVTAPVTLSTGITVTKVFRFTIGGQPGSPRPSDGLPSDTAVDVSSFSPSVDGHQVAFISDASGLPSVWLMNADGTGLTQLTGQDGDEFPYAAEGAAWTPT